MKSTRKLLTGMALMATLVSASAAVPAIPRDEKLEKKVEETLARMTLEEKIGQMTELAIDLICHRGPDGKLVYHPGMLDSIIGKYKVGSILNAPQHSLTPQEWNEVIGKIQEASMRETGIPCIYGLDQNHGATYSTGSTMFPQNIAVAATFNRGIAEEAASITAYETKASACPWTYSPTVDLVRVATWPRVWENFGEDPYLSGEMGAAQVRGFQGTNPNRIGKDKIATSVKHYMAYSMPFSGKDRTPAYVSEADLREKHFEPYRKCIEAGALTVMVNSASVNGLPTHINKRLLTDWLKNELQWDGMIVTDWADINNLFQRERVAKDKKDAIRLAINAGIDMTMDPYNVDFCFLLKELVNEGKVSMDRIDDAVRRILRLKYRLNLFKEPNTGGKDYKEFGSAENAEKALRSAEQTEILLKNVNNLLPLAKGKKILVTGPNANTMRALNGGWTYTWQGNNADALYEPYNTIYEALCNKYGKENVTLKEGVTYNERGQYWEENAPDYASAVAAAADADVIVACIGENSYTETPGNLDDLWLSANQRQLVKELAKTGKPIILVLNEGRPRLITDIEPLAGAIVNVLLPGNYGGDALANLMAGDANFSAKMPYTYPREINALSNYDYKVSEEVGTMEGAYNYDAKVSLLWPFGYGLSYTTYGYSNLRVDRDRFTADDTITVSVDVTNTGKVAGMEPVLLYSSDLVASLVPDNKRLRDFTKISLNPGETKTVTFKLPGNSMAFVGHDGKWILEEGAFELKVANLSVPVTCTVTKVWDTPNM